MKHIKIVFSIIFILCLILFAKKVYGYNQMVIPDGGLLIEQEELSKEKQRVIDASSEYYSYGDMYATAKFKVTKKKDKSGNIVYLLGEGSNAIEWKQAGNMIFDDNENSNKEGTWEVWLDIYYELNISTENKYDVKAQNCYSAKEGDFDPKKDGWQGQRVLDSVVKTVADGVGAVVDAGKNVVNTVKGAVEGLNELKENFQHNPVGTLITLALDLVRAIFGDLPQFIANMIQTATDHTFFEWQYMYEKEELAKNGDGDLNKYTQVGDYEKGKCKDWQKVIDIEKEDDDDKRFAEDTKIPVMTGDLYNVSVGHIDFLDINFLDGNKNHDEGSPWMIMRNLAASLIHIAIYIASAILLVSLIIYGIQIVGHSFDNPEGEAEAKSRLEQFTTSVAMLIGSVLIMGLCIFGSNELFNKIENIETRELPIRVNVETAGYSFSTTAAGYTRYMAGIEDVDEWVEKGLYTIGFIALAWVNLILIILMLVRMIALWILSMIGPITAALHILNIEFGMSFRRWTSLYISLSFVQVLLSILYTIILNYAL